MHDVDDRGLVLVPVQLEGIKLSRWAVYYVQQRLFFFCCEEVIYLDSNACS